MEKNSQSSTSSNVHWFVLCIGLVFALAAWIVWLCIGMNTARNVVAKRINEAVQISQQLASPAPAVAPQKEAINLPSGIDRTQYFAELGQTGDSFGGLNALLTGIAGALVAWAGVLQYLALKHARMEAREERKHRELQAFESLFFHLLQMSSDVTDRIQKKPSEAQRVAFSALTNIKQSPEEPTIKVGAAALDAYAQIVFKANIPLFKASSDNERLALLAEAFLTKVYYRKPSSFGPYFRMLYQTFMHVSNSSLEESEKIRYANIARAQISDGAVLLLALNGLTENGYPFVNVVERFGLLEHMHREYRNKYKKLFEHVYSPRAFMGSKERARPGNEWHPRPSTPQGEILSIISSAEEKAGPEFAFEQAFNDAVSDT